MTHKKKIIKPTSLIINLGILVFFGLIILASATAVVGYEHFGDNYYYLKHQLLYGLLPGLFLFFLCSKIKYIFWKKNAWWIFLISIILLILVFIPGIGSRLNTNALSWIKIGNFTLQPSELAKLGLIIFLAAWFSSKKEHLKSFSNGLLPFVIFMGIIAGLVAFQPDIGTAIIIILIALGIYLTAGAKISHLIALLIAGSGIFTVLVLTAAYRLNRILAFLNPQADLQGVGYHINQALIAIGSGGILGLGLGHSRQKFEYLPEIAGDSIFAIMAEELGFILSALFIILLVFLIIKIFKISKYSSDNFATLFLVGLAIWIGGQSLINIGAMLGILPLTGVPLPFVSYGGTSLLSLMAGCGILVNITKS